MPRVVCNVCMPATICVTNSSVPMDTTPMDTVSTDTVGVVDQAESSGLGSSPTISPSRSTEEVGGDENSKLV